MHAGQHNTMHTTDASICHTIGSTTTTARYIHYTPSPGSSLGYCNKLKCGIFILNFILKLNLEFKTPTGNFNSSLKLLELYSSLRISNFLVGQAMHQLCSCYNSNLSCYRHTSSRVHCFEHALSVHGVQCTCHRCNT